MTTFRDLGLNPMILQALEEIGFETPTPIQSQTIPHLINSGSDLIALAKTGTGKTAAFSLPIIQQLDANDRSVQAFILCPTRELAIQISKDIEEFIKYLPGLYVLPVYGGARIDQQIRALKKGVQIVVGTPGRVRDLIDRKVLKLGGVKWLVLDEADEMLNMGFKEELDDILTSVPENKQVLLFSATMNNQVRKIASNYMVKPDDITVGTKNEGSDNVQHFYYVVHEKDRYQALKRIADNNPNIHGIIFCRTRRETQLIADKLGQDHYSAEAIHGDISQEQRTKVMERFKRKQTQLLVATDVAARGIDVDGLTHVINYKLPESTEAYVHRSGRTGRAHNQGVSLVIVNMREQYKVRHLEKRIGKNFEHAKVPNGAEICENQLFSLVDTVCNVEVNEEQIAKYLDAINKKFENLSREELVKKLISVEFNRFLEHYKNARDLNPKAGDKDRHSQDRGSGKSSRPFARFNINVGRKMGMTVKDFFRLINSQPGLKSAEIGNISIKDNFTIFEIEERLKDQVIKTFDGAQIDDFVINIVCEQTGLTSSRDSGRGKRRPSRPRKGGHSRKSGHSRKRRSY